MVSIRGCGRVVYTACQTSVVGLLTWPCNTIVDPCW